MLVKIKEYLKERFELQEGLRVNCECPNCNTISIMEWGFNSPFISQNVPGWRCLHCGAIFNTRSPGIFAWDVHYYAMNPEKHYCHNSSASHCYYTLNEISGTGIIACECANYEQIK